MKCSAACPTTTQGPVAFNPFKNKSVSQKVRYNAADIDIINTQDEQQAWLHFENSTTYLAKMPTLSYIASNVANTTQFTPASQRAVTQLGAVVCAKTSRLVKEITNNLRVCRTASTLTSHIVHNMCPNLGNLSPVMLPLAIIRACNSYKSVWINKGLKLFERIILIAVSSKKCSWSKCKELQSGELKTVCCEWHNTKLGRLACR